MCSVEEVPVATVYASACLLVEAISLEAERPVEEAVEQVKMTLPWYSQPAEESDRMCVFCFLRLCHMITYDR